MAAWERRLQSGQAGQQMIQGLGTLGRERGLQMFADWTDRIAAGEVPPAPPRPQGLERNVVITIWDWADPKAYLHDEVSTDRRNPRVNANGPIYGALELSADYIPVLDPVQAHDLPGAVDRARSEHAPDLAADAAGLRRTGVGRRVDEQEQRPQPDARRARSRLADVHGPAATPIPTTAARDRRIRRRRSSRSTTPAGILPSTIRRRRSSRTSARASARTT